MDAQGGSVIRWVLGLAGRGSSASPLPPAWLPGHLLACEPPVPAGQSVPQLCLTGRAGMGKRSGPRARRRAPSHLRALIKHLDGRPEWEP